MNSILKTLVAVSMFAAATVQAQQIDFYSVQNGGAGDPNSATGVIRTAGGTPLSGSGFSAQLWGSVSSTDSSTFTLISQTTYTFAFNTIIGTSFYGQIADGGQWVPLNAAFGGTLNYQIRAWDNSTGASFATATTRGASAVASRTLPASSTVQDIPKTDNFNSFSLAVVPEPSVLALGLLGGAVLLFRRRR